MIKSSSIPARNKLKSCQIARARFSALFWLIKKNLYRSCNSQLRSLCFAGRLFPASRTAILVLTITVHLDAAGRIQHQASKGCMMSPCAPRPPLPLQSEQSLMMAILPREHQQEVFDRLTQTTFEQYIRRGDVSQKDMCYVIHLSWLQLPCQCCHGYCCRELCTSWCV